MKVNYLHDRFGRAGFRGCPEEQDGYPEIDFLYTQLAPTWFSGARRGLAAALPYIESVSGKLTFDSKVTPLTASLIRDLLPAGELFVDSNCIEFKPTDIQKGGSTLHVCPVGSLSDADSFVSQAINNREGIRQTALAITPNDGVRGYWSSPQSRIVPSNLWLVKELCSPKSYLNATLALALMYSEDLSAQSIFLYGNWQVSNSYLEGVKQAFFTVGLNLEVNREK